MTLNVKNRTIFCRDNMDILQGINSNSIDLVYLDPPFNKKKQFAAPTGTSAEGASFMDIFKKEDIKDEWVNKIYFENLALHTFLTHTKTDGIGYNYCYLVYMAIRLMECRRVLKDTGSIYLHCDPTMSHYLKIAMDSIFGDGNFINEIIWYYKNASRGKKQYAKSHDVILWYSKDSKRYTFNRDDILQKHESGMTKWRYTKGGQKGQPIPKGKTPDDVITLPSLNAMSKERTGYPTQKPLELLERIIKAGSGKGDVVLDPFCGCATTCVAAEKWDRCWISVDVSRKAYDLVNERMEKEVYPDLFEAGKKAIFTTIPPVRDESIKDEEKGYVYVISNPKYGAVYKVGIAKNLQSRLSSYQTSDPDRAFKVEYEVRCTNYMEIEIAVHKHFNIDRDHEWVYADKDEIISIIKGMAK